MTSSALLSLANVNAGYGAVSVLHDVTFDVEPASIVAVLGANGAGKSTLLKAIWQEIPLRSGTISLAGQNLKGLAVEQVVTRGLAKVPEGNAIIGELSVQENLQLGALWRRDRAAARKDIDELYEIFPILAQRRTQSARSLSGGERQMLALARGLAAAPQLLALDEPSLGLAPKIVADTMRLIQRLRQERGLAVLLVEQNVRSALSIADKVLVLSLGSVVASGDATEFADDASLRHAYLGF
jgi:branched-chain amino acid transport system ATP-binding protein